MFSDADNLDRRFPTDLPTEAQLRHVAVLFVDMVDSTATTDRIGAERSFVLMQDFLDLADRTVQQNGGTTFNVVGDGLLALFGAPAPIERAALNACRSALALVAALQDKTAEMEARHGVQPQIRIGLAAGEVLIADQKDGKATAAGNAVNLAARLHGLAAPGDVVASAALVTEVGRQAAFRSLGRVNLKGFAEPVEAFALESVADRRDGEVAVGTTNLGVRATFVGRARGMAQLTNWLASVTPACVLVGNAGSGKSRLVSEFAAEQTGRRMLVGPCYPETQMQPLFPLIEVLKAQIGWNEDMLPDQIEADIAALAGEDSVRGGMIAALFSGQARPSAPQDLDRAIVIRRHLARAVLGLATRSDRLVVIEDIHWIDPLSFEVLAEVSRKAPVGLKLLGTSRPDDRLLRLPRDRVMTLNTGPLSPADIAQVARSVLGHEGSDPAVVRSVAEQSEGNPFFAIEILRHIARSGPAVDAARIGSIQNVALSGFDRLPEDVRQMLRAAAVIGRTFRYSVLLEAAGLKADTLPGLMQAAQSIVAPNPADAEGSGWFNHILFRDAIYGTIPSAARKTLHRRVATAIETQEADHLEGIADLLAGHYERAGEPQHALRHLEAAAQQAFSIYALQSCNQLLERAVRLIEDNPHNLPQVEAMRVVSLWMRCLDLMGLSRRLIAISEVWQPRLADLQATPDHVVILALTGKAFCHGADYPRSLQLLNRALELALQIGDTASITLARVMRMRVLVDGDFGDLAEVERLFEETRSESETLDDPGLYATRMYHMIAAFRREGQMGRAIALTDELLATGQARNLSHAIVVGAWARALIGILTNDPRLAISYSELALRHSVPGTTHWRVCIAARTTARLRLGDDVSVEEFQRLVDHSDEVGDFTLRNAAMTNLPLALFRKGRIRQGWRAFHKVLRFNAESGHAEAKLFIHLYVAEVTLTLAGLIGPKGGPRPKLGAFDLAVAIWIRLNARRMARRSLRQLMARLAGRDGHFTARAEVGLGVIAWAEGKPDEARIRFDRAAALFSNDGLEGELGRLQAIRERACL